MFERIHIVGVSPRTGTTLLMECMTACFRIDAFDSHETPITQHRRGAGIYLSKLPADIFTIGPRLSVDRHLHVIAMLRDPRDVIVSRHGADPGRFWAPLWFWKTRIPLLRRLQRHKRFITIRYEDLVSDPDGVQSRMHERLPFLERTGRFSDFHLLAKPSRDALRALGPVRPITEKSVGRWRAHLERVAGQLQQHGPITEELIEFGYETDGNWLQLLDDVMPELAPSFWAEKDNRPKWRVRLQRTRKAYGDAAAIAAARLLRMPLV